ncbi:MAG: right-handed parallel beta-helix repeat-containing protein [Bdellovibrionaceae bacterium]|nr:right-handed parallel beta-helix repeat-containing protein [Bdellovibrionales bacterium]MCB9084181.1 right-handed parallel beta-helix repeat-containing protein [Pseudobdellovibrionaceae bacterium]
MRRILGTYIWGTMILAVILLGCSGEFQARNSLRLGSEETLSPLPGDPSFKREIKVTTVEELTSALALAEPGDDIIIGPGSYEIEGNVMIARAGTSEEPIRLRAAMAGDALLEMNPGSSPTEGFVVRAPYWILENLVIRGSCIPGDHSKCENAVHIRGEADHLIVRNNTMTEFNSMIRGSGSGVSGSPYKFANDVLLANNRLYNSSARDTSGNVNFIDVSGGARWTFRRNFLYDFSKNLGDKTSYGISLRGNSRDAVFESNLVACSRYLASGTRVGLSLGGDGLSLSQSCENMNCSTEHTNGTVRNNIVIGCSDAGIYLNKANNTLVIQNTLVGTEGIHVRDSEATARVINNLVSGSIWASNKGGIIMNTGNQIREGEDLFNNYLAGDFKLTQKGESDMDTTTRDPAALHDYCGQVRTATTEVGAIEYGTATSSSCLDELLGFYQAF